MDAADANFASAGASLFDSAVAWASQTNLGPRVTPPPTQPALPVAERAGDEVLSLPLSPAHSDDDIRDAIDALQRVHTRFAD